DDAIAVSLEVPAELRAEFAGLPGQHVVLRTELGGEEVRRTYSLTNTPGEWPLRIVARVHEHGRMSRYLAEKLQVGDEIDVLPPNASPPRGQVIGGPAARSTATAGASTGGPATGANVAPDAAGALAGRTYVGFAAGCGITPVLSIVKSVLRADPA